MQERTLSAIPVVDLFALAKRSYNNRHPCTSNRAGYIF